MVCFIYRIVQHQIGTMSKSSLERLLQNLKPQTVGMNLVLFVDGTDKKQHDIHTA